MDALVVPQLGNDREEAQLVDPGPVDAAEERVRQAVDHRAAEPVAQERPDRDVLAVEPARQDDVEPGPQLLGPREEPGRHEGRHPGREDEAHPLGHRDHLAAGADVDAARVCRADDDVAEPELAAQLGGGGPVGDERIRPGLHQEAVDPLGPDLAAELLRRLHEEHRHAGPRQLVRRREAGDPAADDDRAAGAHRVHPAPAA